MKVLSSRSQSQTRSNSKTRRTGISLTSKSDHSSLPKPTTSSDTKTTSNCCLSIDTQLSILNDHEMTNAIDLTQNNLSNRGRIGSFTQQNQITSLPKITFRYSNNVSKIQFPEQQNSFILHQNFVQASVLGSKYLASHEIRSNNQLSTNSQYNIVRIAESIQKRQNSKSKYNYAYQQPELNPNPIKKLIDSSCIDRQIIREQIYQNISQVSARKNSEQHSSVNILTRQTITVNVTQPPSLKDFSSSISKQVKKKSDQNCQSNMSPYQILISTAKRCQSKEVSPSILKENEKLFSLPSKQRLQNIPETQQFILNINEQVDSETSRTIELKQASTMPSIPFETCYKQNKYKLERQGESQPLLSEENLTNLPIQFAQLSIQSSPSRQNSKQQTVKQCQPLSIKQLNCIETDKLKQKECKQFVSLTKRIAKNKVLQDIENHSPQIHQTNPQSSLSGKRNIKRIRQIQRRLQQIITICNKNI